MRTAFIVDVELVVFGYCWNEKELKDSTVFAVVLFVKYCGREVVG